MNSIVTIDDVRVRNDLRPGDLGYVIHRHVYKRFGFVLTEEKESTALRKSLKEQRYELIICSKA